MTDTTMNTGAASLSDEQIFDAAHEACECRTAAGGFIFANAAQLRAFGEVLARQPAAIEQKNAIDHPAALDEKALATAQEIALMWGRDRSQFVSRIQVAVRDAMDWVRAASTSANVAQGAEAIYQAKIIVDPKWTDVTKSEFDNYVELGGFDTRIVYAAPPAQTATMDDARDAIRYRWMRDFNVRSKDGVDIKPPCEHVHASIYSHAVGTIPAVRLAYGEELDRAIDAALTAAQSASEDTK